MGDQQAEVKEPKALDPDEIEFSDPELDQRLWLRTLAGIINTHPAEGSYSPRVQFARDQVTIAACERMTRILNSDLEPTE